MRKVCVLGLTLALALAATTAYAAPNVANTSQKGSLQIWPDIRVDGNWNTLVRIQNDGVSDVDITCYWMDGNKNRVDFNFPLTANAAVWFDARTGNGTFQINPFPNTPSNGFDNPFLITPPFTSENGTNNDNVPAPPQLNSLPYPRGMLACWVVDAAGINQIKYNHISGTATVWHPTFGAYEYNAWSFFVNQGIDLQPVCGGPQPPCVPTPGVLNLNAIEYDQCPMFLLGQFTPEGAPVPLGAFPVNGNRLAIAGCTLNLNQDWSPVYTKLEFEVWNADERKLTGAFECADSWHETEFNAFPTLRSGGWIDAGAQNFTFAAIGTYSARYRVRGIKSSQCEAPASGGNPAIVTQAVGLLGVQSSLITTAPGDLESIGTTNTASGRLSGVIRANVGILPPEGGIQ
jgi:hypothetical protein